MMQSFYPVCYLLPCLPLSHSAGQIKKGNFEWENIFLMSHFTVLRFFNKSIQQAVLFYHDQDRYFRDFLHSVYQ